ncbi:hypothetical protein A2W14_07140 [Candidatus Gottesmanbacteria bacterium RBG_16_37_8]|uniref:Fido domain-containing protein n=1 Tax=Candidatus Gottesmanbacteria bacterium RBG_16_37_8 TaxID=1798371 RepID=A0A1F5YNH0_9BACT|nr:MAG: hypothetical protein A2W14_07140 [Candidatus Gottesmanbacteria bacterium RBG_16_37_8]
MKIPSKNWPKSETEYIKIEEIVAIHERMIEIGGGREGIRDFTLLHSACERPKATFSGQLLYSNIWFQAAALIQSLIRNHPFNDGNKRTGYFSTVRFLNLNGYELEAKKKQIIGFTLSIDIKKLNVEQISSWLKKQAKRSE